MNRTWFNHLCRLAVLGCLISVAATGCKKNKENGTVAQNPAPANPAPVQEAQPAVAPAKPMAADQRKIEVIETKWPSGKLKSREEGYYGSDGEFVKDGTETSWYESGQKKIELHYRDNLLDGERTTWFENGRMHNTGSYKEGKSHGIWTEWFSDGQKSQEMSYNRGAYQGVFTEWWTNGTKKREALWVDGKETNIRVWNEEGKELFVLPPTKATTGGH